MTKVGGDYGLFLLVSCGENVGGAKQSAFNGPDRTFSRLKYGHEWWTRRVFGSAHISSRDMRNVTKCHEQRHEFSVISAHFCDTRLWYTCLQTCVFLPDWHHRQLYKSMPLVTTPIISVTYSRTHTLTSALFLCWGAFRITRI